jgi:hypothetical protein
MGIVKPFAELQHLLTFSPASARRTTDRTGSLPETAFQSGDPEFDGHKSAPAKMCPCDNVMRP